MAELNNDKINVSGKGINTDSSPEFQPEGTQRYVLNGVNESDTGDVLLLSNEPGTEEIESLPSGYSVISKLYMTNKETILFLVNEDGDSMIGVFDAGTERFQIYIDDRDSTDKLNFSHEYPIDATYRLRRGCERTVYFTDYNNPPRLVNLDSLEDYYNVGLFSASKTNLFRSTSIRPDFKEIEVIDSGGQLLPGSYNFAVQYVDESLNPTEWFTVSDTVVIYNDSLGSDYKKIKGSINSTEEGLDYGITNKSIRIKTENLDPSFTYYRIAIIQATSGNGQVTKVNLTDIIPVQKNTFIYTGINTTAIGTESEIIAEKLIINKAKHILQIDNSLLLGNIKGSEVPFCQLQQYASLIVSDVVVKKIVIDDVDSPHSSKNPTLNIVGQGYTPGEIYSFGIQYLFEDGELSPVFHIPGKSYADATTVFSPGANTYPMSPNNVSLNTRYIENNNCGTSSYWGKDYRGRNLANALIRHHRFPTRSDLGLSLITTEDVNEVTDTSVILKIEFQGNTTIANTDGVFPNTLLNVVYSVNGILTSTTVEIPYNRYFDGVNNTISLNDSIEIPTPPNSGSVSIVNVEEVSYINNTEASFEFGGDATSDKTGLSYTLSSYNQNQTKIVKRYSTNILGIKFSNIKLPSEEITGKKVVGYYIVRNERTDSEKTILDSAVLTPCLQNKKYISHGLLFPEISGGGGQATYSQNVFSIIHPQHKFFEKSVQGYTSIVQEGIFVVNSRKKSVIRYEDVVDGSSYDAENHKSNEKDDDGFDLKVAIRDNEVSYLPTQTFAINTNEVEEIFYLDSLESRDIERGEKTIYNIAADNKIGILHLKAQKPNLTAMNLRAYYVIFKRDNLDSYSNFRNLEYFKEHDNYETAESVTLFHGDSYVSPMRYANNVFWDIQVTKRAGKSSFWKKLAGALLIVAGAVFGILTAGAAGALVAVGAGLLLGGTGTLFLAAGFKRDAWNKAYGEEYEKGLRETALDSWVNETYRKRSGVELIPADDEIQWIGDVVTNLWFESSTNISLRHGMKGDLPSFLEAPGNVEDGNNAPENFYTLNGIRKLQGGERLPVSDVEFFFANKLLYFDPERKSSRAYYGHSLAEYYKINEDYLRRNKQKISFHLPLEYDCCSDCNEVFPHRWHWSQQSFQEELIDNYRVFLPNNYRDLDGETGEITNIFRIGNDMFVHTQLALYNCPRNYQERVTDQVVSFIGTGELFSIPPQKIQDSTVPTGGTNLKWARVKTVYGYFFVSDVDEAIYNFNGQNLKKISDKDMRKEFSKILPIDINREYYRNNGVNSPLLDKVSAQYGLGYILTYDEKYKRVIITKKDSNVNINKSFTISYDLKTESWVSFHSYMPDHYIELQQEVYSIEDGKIHKHNVVGIHNQYYGTKHPFIVEYVSSLSPNAVTTTEYIYVPSTAFKYSKELEQYTEVNDVFFNKMIAYNSRQCTGLLNLNMKDEESEDFFQMSIKNTNDENVTISNKEHVWKINELRDNRIDYTKPIFYTDYIYRQDDYYVDKILNTSSIDMKKDWSQKEMLRDRYLIVRLIFDNFVDTKLVMNISGKNETISIR